MNVFWGLAAAALIVLGVYFFATPEHAEPRTADPKVLPVVELPKLKIGVTEGVERFYTNDARTFSFRLPDGFSASDLASPEPGVTGVVVESPTYGQLFVLVQRAQTFVLTEENIRASLSGTVITDMRQGFLGTLVPALLFRAEHERVELWAVHNGTLYRIVTTLDNLDLLEFIASNWYFAPPAPTRRNG